MSTDCVNLTEPWLRKCRKCGSNTVVIYNNDKQCKCGGCGAINKILWLPTTYIIKERVD